MSYEPAFPRPETEFTRGCEGMSLHDWYVGQALIGLLGNENFNVPEAFHLADEIMRVRSLREEP